MDWFVEVMRKYAVFSGRARRAEYWYFFLIYTVVYLALAIADVILGTFSMENGIGLLTGIFALATLLPSVGVSVRRLHDTNRSGWWLLLFLIPLIGTIVAIILLSLKGTEGENRFGPDPLAGQ